jgi:CRISPR-associated protein Cas5d
MPDYGPPRTDYPHPDLALEVSSQFACWTRPELKTERVSYPVPTPSGARGVVEAVFWKPEVSVVIRRIEIMGPICWTRITRNEVASIVTDEWLARAQSDPGHRFDAAEDRDQRSTLLLRDVRYRISFQYVLRPHATAPIAKYRDQFRRRVERGACYSQPFLGAREFSASNFGPGTGDNPEPVDLEPFVMLHSIDYGDRGQETYSWFVAEVRCGVLDVPAHGIELGTPSHRAGASQAGG